MRGVCFFHGCVIVFVKISYFSRIKVGNQAGGQVLCSMFALRDETVNNFYRPV